MPTLIVPRINCKTRPVICILPEIYRMTRTSWNCRHHNQAGSFTLSLNGNILMSLWAWRHYSESEYLKRLKQLKQQALQVISGFSKLSDVKIYRCYEKLLLLEQFGRMITKCHIIVLKIVWQWPFALLVKLKELYLKNHWLITQP